MPVLNNIRSILCRLNGLGFKNTAPCQQKEVYQYFLGGVFAERLKLLLISRRHLLQVLFDYLSLQTPAR